MVHSKEGVKAAIDSAEVAERGRVGRLVEGARRRMRAAAAIGGVCHWVVTALGLWLVFFVSDNLLALPAGLRLPLAVAGGLLLLVVLFRRVLVPLCTPLRPERVAVMLESRFGIGENLLINAYQFERRKFSEGEAMFAGRTIGLSAGAAERVELGQLWEARRLVPWVVGAVLVLGAWLVYGMIYPGLVANATQRYTMPLADVAPPGAPVIRVTPGQDTFVVEGDTLEVRAQVEDNRPVAQGRNEPPVIAWIENGRSVPTVRGGGDEAAMAPVGGKKEAWKHTFAGIRRPFVFRVFAAGTYSGSIAVRVLPLPKITSSLFRVTAPAYTGLEPASSAGPPAALAALAGSQVEVEIAVEPAPRQVRWRDPSGAVELKLEGGKWRGARVISKAAAYEIEGRIGKLEREIVIAKGAMQVTPDAAPEVEFAVGERNRFAYPGGVLSLAVRAKDDFGLKGVWVTSRVSAAEGGAPAELKRWSYIGPPGRKEETRERLELRIDPGLFRVGESYFLEAWAGDFNPAGRPSVSKPILLRIRSPIEADLERGDRLAPAFEQLKQTLAAQERANGLTGNLRAHIEEAVAKRDLAEHRRVIGEAQEAALQSGRGALEAFQASEEGRRAAAELGPLVTGEMPWIQGDVARLEGGEVAAAAEKVEAIMRRQEHVRQSLLGLLGRIAGERRGKGAEGQEADKDGAAAKKAAAKDLKTGLRSFIRDQKRIVERTKALAEKPEAERTEAERQAVGELAREEAEWAKFFQEQADEAAKQPAEAAAEAAVAQEVNEVALAVQAAAEALYEKDPARAVPMEQAGVEGAEKMAANLERQLAAAPEEGKKDKKEEAPKDDAPAAEQAAKAEDLVRKMIESEAALGQDVEEVAKARRKAAASEAAKRPAAGASGKDAVGRDLEKDVAGSASGGPPGRSKGKMTGKSVEGATMPGGSPFRFTAAPLEPGDVKDSATLEPGGATGGGKATSAFGEEGRAGGDTKPLPPEERAPRLAAQQTFIRQEAEALALRLRAQRMPTGDLENAVQAMRQVERGIGTGDGLEVQQAYDSAMDALADARATARAEAGVLRESARLPDRVRGEITSGLRDAIPQGYDEMISAYFRALAEGDAGGAAAPPADGVAPQPAR